MTAFPFYTSKGRAKKMKLMDWKGWSLQKHINLLLKVATLLLFLGLGFILLSRSSTPSLDRVEEIETPLVSISNGEANDVPKAMRPAAIANASDYDDSSPLGEDSPSEEQEQISGQEKCNLFTGDWIPNPSGPVYTNESCPFIEEHQNCLRNGRPDSGYLYWRWKPQYCELPQFDAGRFLEVMRNKSWALIGDSISRNHVQSMLCMLATVEKPTEVYHDEGYKTRRWRFPSYNFTIHVIWSPFLVKAAIFEDMNGVSTSEVELHLDELDPNWTELYLDLHYMVISTGKWFQKPTIYYENNTLIGCYKCNETRNLTTLGYDFAYERTLQRVLNFIATTPHEGSVFFRTSTPDHFEDGKWDTGGTCPRTEPDKKGEMEVKELSKTLRNIELEKFEEAAGVAERNGVRMKILDLSSLMQKRPDGHPGPYRHFQPFAEDEDAKVQNDCLHWCLPGPIDFWNDVIMEMVVNGS